MPLWVAVREPVVEGLEPEEPRSRRQGSSSVLGAAAVIAAVVAVVLAAISHVDSGEAFHKRMHRSPCCSAPGPERSASTGTAPCPPQFSSESLLAELLGRSRFLSLSLSLSLSLAAAPPL